MRLKPTATISGTKWLNYWTVGCQFGFFRDGIVGTFFFSFCKEIERISLMRNAGSVWEEGDVFKMWKLAVFLSTETGHFLPRGGLLVCVWTVLWPSCGREGGEKDVPTGVHQSVHFAFQLFYLFRLNLAKSCRVRGFILHSNTQWWRHEKRTKWRVKILCTSNFTDDYLIVITNQRTTVCNGKHESVKENMIIHHNLWFSTMQHLVSVSKRSYHRPPGSAFVLNKAAVD